MKKDNVCKKGNAEMLAAPGHQFGPCLNENCKHNQCVLYRIDAESLCPLCGNRIGYETRYYREDEQPLIHAGCIDEKQESALELPTAYRIHVDTFGMNTYQSISEWLRNKPYYEMDCFFARWLTTLDPDELFQLAGRFDKYCSMIKDNGEFYEHELTAVVSTAVSVEFHVKHALDIGRWEEIDTRLGQDELIIPSEIAKNAVNSEIERRQDGKPFEPHWLFEHEFIKTPVKGRDN